MTLAARTRLKSCPLEYRSCKSVSIICQCRLFCIRIPQLCAYIKETICLHDDVSSAPTGTFTRDKRNPEFFIILSVDFDYPKLVNCNIDAFNCKTIKGMRKSIVVTSREKPNSTLRTISV